MFICLKEYSVQPKLEFKAGTWDEFKRRKEKINRPSKFYIIQVNSANNPNILSLLKYKSGKATDGSR